MNNQDINLASNSVFRGIIYGVTIIVTLWLVSGFLAPLILAAIVASMFIKIKPWCPTWLKNSNNLYAALATIASLLVVLIPLILLMVLLGLEAVNFGNFVSSMLTSEGFDLLINSFGGVEKGINNTLEPLGMGVNFEDMRNYLMSSATNLGSLLYDNARNVMFNIAGILINGFFFLFITFFLVRDGETIIEEAKALMPFKKEDAQSLVDAVEHVGQTVILGSIASSIILGLIMTVIFWIFGFTSPFLWGLAIMFLSLIPVIGTWIIYLPSLLFLAFAGAWWVPLLFLGTVLFIDSFLFYAVIRPRFLDAKTQLYPLAIFLAILGGITTFGPIGIVYGPCIMAIFITLMRHYMLVKHRSIAVAKKA